MIGKLVDEVTAAGGISILDLHWSNDDTEQQPMPLKGGFKGDAVDFWASVSEKFGTNDHVMYELYNEPHMNDIDVYLNGNDDYTGMLDMIAAIRKNS